MEEHQKAPDKLSSGSSLRGLLLFQLKLALDALRDVALSPLSVFAFFLDTVLRPTREDSLFLRLMALGRRSDRVINLFGEYDESDDFTVDRAFSEVEEAVKPHWEDVPWRHSRGAIDSGGAIDDGSVDGDGVNSGRGALPAGKGYSGRKK